MLERFMDYDIIVVYASGIMCEDVAVKLQEAQAHFSEDNIPLKLLMVQCPRLTRCTVMKPSDFLVMKPSQSDL
jgi:hypothetical protein